MDQAQAAAQGEQSQDKKDVEAGEAEPSSAAGRLWSRVVKAATHGVNVDIHQVS